MDVVWFLLIGLAAGWLSGQLMGTGDRGLVGDLVVGVIGALLGGLLFRIVGIVVGAARATRIAEGGTRTWGVYRSPRGRTEGGMQALNLREHEPHPVGVFPACGDLGQCTRVGVGLGRHEAGEVVGGQVKTEMGSVHGGSICPSCTTQNAQILRSATVSEQGARRRRIPPRTSLPALRLSA